MWQAILSALMGGYSMYESYENQRQAKRAQKRQREQDAWDQLLSAAGGYQPPRQAQAEAVPGTNYGRIGQAVLSDYQNAQQEQEQDAWARSQQEATLRETNRANLAREKLAAEQARVKVESKPLRLESAPTGKRSAVDELKEMDAWLEARKSGKPMNGQGPHPVDAAGSEDLERDITNLEALRAAGQLDTEGVRYLDEMKKLYSSQIGSKYKISGLDRARLGI